MDEDELAGAISSCAIDGLAILCKRASSGSTFSTINSEELEELSSRILQGEASKSDFENPSSLGTVWASMVKVAVSFNLPQYFQHPEDQDFSNIPVHYSRFIGAFLSTFEILLDVLPAEIETLVQDLQHVFFPEDLAVSPTQDGRIEDKMVQLVREYKDLFPYAYMFNRRSGKYPKSSVDVVNRYYKMRHSLMSSQSMTNSEDYDYDYRQHGHDSPHSPHPGDEEDSVDRSKYSGGGGDDDTLGDSFTSEHFPDLSTPGIAPLKPFNNNVSSTSAPTSLNNNASSRNGYDLSSPGREYADSVASGSSPDMGNRDGDGRIPYTPDGASILDAYYQTITTTGNNNTSNNNVVFNNNNLHNNNNGGYAHRMIIREEEDEDDSDDPEHPYHSTNHHQLRQKHVKRVTRMKRSMHNSSNMANNSNKMTRRRPSEDELIASNTNANSNILASSNSNNNSNNNIIANSNNFNNSLRLSTKTVTFAPKNEYQDYTHSGETRYNDNDDHNASVSLSQESDDALAFLARDKDLSNNSGKKKDDADNEVLMFDDVLSDDDNAVKFKPSNSVTTTSNSNKVANAANYRYNSNGREENQNETSTSDKGKGRVFSAQGNGHDSDSSLELSDGGHSGGSNSNNSKYNATDNVNRRYRNPLNATLEEEEFLSQKQASSKSQMGTTAPPPSSELKLNRYDVDDVEDNDTLTSNFSNNSNNTSNKSTHSTSAWANAKPVSGKSVLPAVAPVVSTSLNIQATDDVQVSPVTSPQYQSDMRNGRFAAFTEKPKTIDNNKRDIQNEANNSPSKRKPFSYEVQYEEYLNRNVSDIQNKLRAQQDSPNKTYLVADEIDPALFAPPHATVKDNLRKFKEQKMKQQQKPKEKAKDHNPNVFVPEFLTERRHYLLEQLQQPKENDEHSHGKYPDMTAHHPTYEEEEEENTETIAESLKDVSDIRRSLELWRSHYQRPLDMLQEWENYWQQQKENKANGGENQDTTVDAQATKVGTKSVSSAASVAASQQFPNAQNLRSSSASSSLGKMAGGSVSGSVNGGGAGFRSEEEEELWQIQQLNAQYHVSGANSIHPPPVNKGKHAGKTESVVSGGGSVRSSSSPSVGGSSYSSSNSVHQQQPFQDLPPVTAASQASVLPPLTELGKETGVILEGYLLKKSTKNFINRWKKRYFVLRESAVSFCELCIYGEAVESAWGHIPLSLKAVIPLCDVAAVEAVGGKNTATAPLTLHLKFQPFHDDPPQLNSSTNNKKKGMFSRLFSSSDQSNHNNKPDAMRRSTGTTETLGSKSINNNNNNANANANPSLPPTVPKRAQSMRLSSSSHNPDNAYTTNAPTDPITLQRSLSASSQQWEVGSNHSFASSDSENNHQNTSKKSKRELQAMGYYGKVVKEMYLQTDTPEMRLLWVTTLSKAAQFVREAEWEVMQQEKEEQERQLRQQQE